MPLRPIGKAPPLSHDELAPLWSRLAIYLERSSTALNAAWTLDAQRVRALPRFRLEPRPIALVVAVANAAAYAADASLLAYAEELRADFDRQSPTGDAAAYSRTVVACAIEHARRRCGAPNEEREALDRLAAQVKAQGRVGTPEAADVLLRAGRVEVIPLLELTVFSDETFVSLMREAGGEALAELARQSVRMPVRVELPEDEATRFYPYLGADGFSHRLLAPASRAHEHPEEAAAAFTATARPSDGIFGSMSNVAVALAIAAGIGQASSDARALSALRENPIWFVSEALHFPRVRKLLAARAPSLVHAKSAPAARAVLESLAVLGMDDRAADKQITAAIQTIVADTTNRFLGLLALFRVAVVRGLPVAANRVVAKLPAPNRVDPWMELARIYADAGDLAGVVELLGKIESVNHCRPEQTNPLALAALRALTSGAQ